MIRGPDCPDVLICWFLHRFRDFCGGFGCFRWSFDPSGSSARGGPKTPDGKEGTPSAPWSRPLPGAKWAPLSFELDGGLFYPPPPHPTQARVAQTPTEARVKIVKYRECFISFNCYACHLGREPYSWRAPGEPSWRFRAGECFISPRAISVPRRRRTKLNKVSKGLSKIFITHINVLNFGIQ